AGAACAMTLPSLPAFPQAGGLTLCSSDGSRDRTRTYNLPVNSRTLCRLSYAGSTRIRVAHLRRARDVRRSWRPCLSEPYLTSTLAEGGKLTFTGVVYARKRCKMPYHAAIIAASATG